MSFGEGRSGSDERKRGKSENHDKGEVAALPRRRPPEIARAEERKRESREGLVRGRRDSREGERNGKEGRR